MAENSFITNVNVIAEKMQVLLSVDDIKTEVRAVNENETAIKVLAAITDVLNTIAKAKIDGDLDNISNNLLAIQNAQTNANTAIIKAQESANNANLALQYKNQAKQIAGGEIVSDSI